MSSRKFPEINLPMQINERESENENGSDVTPRMRMFRIPGLSSTEIKANRFIRLAVVKNEFDRIV